MSLGWSKQLGGAPLRMSSQGTLYGSNTLGGLIKFVTTDPDPSHRSGRIEVDGSTVDSGGSGYGLRGAVNLPVNDAVALRVSAYDRRDPGFIDDPMQGTHDVNGAVDDF